jgi:hypothetical protein
MKRVPVLLSILVTYIAGAAQSVNLSTARERASKVLYEKFGASVPRPQRKAVAARSTATQPYYLFADQSNQYFVIISGDESMPQVLGYGVQQTSARRSTGTLPTTLQEWLKLYEEELKNRKDKETNTATTCIPVAPLLQDDWQTYAPFNGACPYYKYDDGTLSTDRCPVGCVATALSQIMHYYRYPEQLQDTLHGWSTDHYELTDILPVTPIDWANIRDHYYEGEYSEAEANAVARLSLYCSMSVHMNFGPTESGAHVYNVPEQIKRVMGYKYARYYDRTFYTPDAWNKLLQNELTNGRPILYAGFNMARSGHAFVVDGVDADGLYHINWGYGGDYNGYFNIDVLNPFEPPYDTTEEGILQGFYCNQETVVLHPDAQESCTIDSLEQSINDLRLDSFALLSPATDKGYVPMDLYLTNRTKETLTYGVGVLAWDVDKTDSLTWNDITYIGLGGATFLPGTSTKVRIYNTFSGIGDKRIGITFDGENVMVFNDAVTVKSGREIAPHFDTFRPQEITDSTATFLLSMENPSDTYWSIPLITYALQSEDGQPETRHWSIPILEPKASTTQSITFKGLQPDTRYTLLLRYPWNVQQEYPFTTTATAIECIEGTPGASVRYYDLSGRPLPSDGKRNTRVVIRQQGNKSTKLYK